MDAMSSGPSDYLAAERTFLAWIRTGLALMGFGFVVARFGLFLRALRIGQPSLPAESYGLSFWFGTALIILGVIVNILSARHHLRLVQDLNQGGAAFKRPSTLAVVVALALAVMGLAMAIYLFSVGDRNQVSFGVGQEKR
jgi:putative membrane protein